MRAFVLSANCQIVAMRPKDCSQIPFSNGALFDTLQRRQPSMSFILIRFSITELSSDKKRMHHQCFIALILARTVKNTVFSVECSQSFCCCLPLLASAQMLTNYRSNRAACANKIDKMTKMSKRKIIKICMT